jgi:hypothetical protein
VKVAFVVIIDRPEIARSIEFVQYCNARGYVTEMSKHVHGEKAPAPKQSARRSRESGAPIGQNR